MHLAMTTKAPASPDGAATGSPDAEYERLTRSVSKDELHEQIARHGLGVLARGVPYVVQAARWRRIDAARRASRERTLDTDPADTGQIMSPFEAAVASESRRALVDALSELPDADVLAVWRHAEGVPDEDIARAIEELGAGTLSAAGVRKRRERALAQLRHLLKRP